MNRCIQIMRQSSLLPPWPKDIVKPIVITGLEALGRGADRMNMVGFAQQVIQTVGVEAFLKTIRPVEFISAMATTFNIEPEAWIKGGDEVAADDQNAQLLAMVEQLGPEAIKAMVAMFQQQQQQGSAPQ